MLWDLLGAKDGHSDEMEINEIGLKQQDDTRLEVALLTVSDEQALKTTSNE